MDRTLAYVLVRWLLNVALGTLAIIIRKPSTYGKVYRKKMLPYNTGHFITEIPDLLQIGTSVPFTFCILYFVQVEMFVLKLYLIVGLFFLNGNICLDCKRDTMNQCSL